MIAYAGVNSNDNESSRSSAHHSQSQSESYSESHHQTATTVMQVQVENFARLYNALNHDRGGGGPVDDCVGTSSGRPLCRYCGRSYSSPSNLRQHVKNVHSNWPPQNTWPQCNVCGKRCKTKHYLINHQLQAHGIHQRSNVSSNLNQNQ